MPKIYLLLFAIALLLASFMSTADQNLAKPQTARITWGEWPPYHSRSHENQGLYTQLILEAYKTVDISVEFGIFPWKRALMLVQTTGSVWQGSSGWGKGAEREEIFLFTDAMHQGCMVFFHKLKTTIDWTRPESLSGLTIGVVSGFRSSSKIRDLKNSGLDIKIDEVSEEKFGMRMLNAGRIDAFVSDRGVGQTILDQELNRIDGQTIIAHPNPLYCTSYHLLFAKQKLGSQYLVQKFNSGLKVLRDNGRYEEIMGEP